MATFEDLSREMKFEIMLGLDPQDLQNICRVSSDYADICKYDDFWLARYKQDYGNEPRIDPDRSWKINWFLRFTEKEIVISLIIELDMKVEGVPTTDLVEYFEPTEGEVQAAESALNLRLPEVMARFNIDEYSLSHVPDNPRHFILKVYTAEAIDPEEILGEISSDIFGDMNQNQPCRHRDREEVWIGSDEAMYTAEDIENVRYNYIESFFDGNEDLADSSWENYMSRSFDKASYRCMLNINTYV